MQTTKTHPFNIAPSRIPGKPTIVLVGPQACGKTLFAKALAMKLSNTHVIDGPDVNGVTMSAEACVPHDGALVIGDQDGGDLTITVHTQAGFDALLTALRIPLSHRRPYSHESVRGPGDDFQWDTSRSYTPSAISGEALSSNTD